MSVRKAAYVMVLITTIGASYAAGYFTSAKFVNKGNKTGKTAGTGSTVNTAYIQNQNPFETIKGTTKITQKITYTKGVPKTIITTASASNDIIGLNKSETEKLFKQMGFIMVNFSANEVILTKDETDKWPPNCYIVKEDKGLLTVFKSNENGILAENPYEAYDIKVDNLMPEEKEEFTKGRIFENMEEIDSLINDLSS